MTDFRELCVELVNELHGYKVAHPNHDTDLIDRARAALAEPEPEGPTDEELFAVAEAYAEDNGLIGLHNATDFARAALARWGQPSGISR